jgi:hypothetical protein
MGRSNAERSLRMSAEREVDRDCVTRRKIEAAIAQRGTNAFAVFFDGDIRQADHGEKALECRDYVHFDQISVEAEHGCAQRLEEHPKMPFAGSIP